ncbi:retropepsin-like aspartic protease [Brachyspira sp. G79]|uniref:retropepsin-like aspartic protease n=1 Tax=Brachyspira sp. G79 TaxID=1358104 RepID=UPI000BBC3BBD|nr:retropepsin-like aspartic protease [Brachyspira sp. G79]PCG20567.1 hypothetical protein KQ44_11600 [Brachyspira sp. G79]
MPKLTLPIVNNQAICEAFIYDNISHQRITSNENKVRVLFDTGATNSAVTSKVIKQLNIQPISKRAMLSPLGTSEVNIYKVNIFLPFPQNIALSQELFVSEIADNPTFDVIIGMDIIQRGCLIISDKAFIFSI